MDPMFKRITMKFDNVPEQIKIAGDITAGGTTVATLLGYLPAIAALISIVYGLLRIWEWFEKRKK